MGESPMMEEKTSLTI